MSHDGTRARACVYTTSPPNDDITMTRYIELLDRDGGYRPWRRLRGHTAPIRAIDWSADGAVLQTCCGTAAAAASSSSASSGLDTTHTAAGAGDGELRLLLPWRHDDDDDDDDDDNADDDDDDDDR